MKLPKNSKKLTEIYNQASTPMASDFDGEYYVQMITGLPSLRRINHRKVFSTQNGRTTGNNILFGGIEWGYFFLEDGVCDELCGQKVVMINYDRSENSFLTKRIRDCVKCVEDGKLYLGRFNLLIDGELKFFGYFSLEKKN